MSLKSEREKAAEDLNYVFFGPYGFNLTDELIALQRAAEKRAMRRAYVENGYFEDMDEEINQLLDEEDEA